MKARLRWTASTYYIGDLLTNSLQYHAVDVADATHPKLHHHVQHESDWALLWVTCPRVTRRTACR